MLTNEERLELIREAAVLDRISKLTEEMALLALDIEKYSGEEKKRRHNRIVEINALLNQIDLELPDDSEKPA
ncbi:MAG: hypothetical protein HYT03_01785 [Candidatus Harrisonbacteria bacterium]|nr:hypothetical protein [Candidatus Harrisonbacteria bacterium]